jgi:hypothetical protein
MISPPRRSASASEASVLPTAVGPVMTTTCGRPEGHACELISLSGVARERTLQHRVGQEPARRLEVLRSAPTRRRMQRMWP